MINQQLIKDMNRTNKPNNIDRAKPSSFKNRCEKTNLKSDYLARLCSYQRLKGHKIFLKLPSIGVYAVLVTIQVKMRAQGTNELKASQSVSQYVSQRAVLYRY